MASEKNWRDYVYLSIISVQFLGMLALDLVDFYPKALYAAPEAPLHFLVTLRKAYLDATGDPFFGPAGNVSWFRAFLYIEGFVQFPLAAFLIWRLSGKAGTTGAAETAGVVFGALTAMGSVACVSTLADMGPDEVDPAMKKTLFFGVYLPFVIIPIFLAIDMHMRLMKRLNALDARLKAEEQARQANQETGESKKAQ